MSFTMFFVLLCAIFGSNARSAKNHESWAGLSFIAAAVSLVLETLLRLIKP
jgi:hypothetical protein